MRRMARQPLDLSTMPALQVHYPAYRTLSVFCADDDEVTMYKIANPGNRLTAIVFTTQAEVEARPEVPAGRERPPRWLVPTARSWTERDAYFSRSRVLGGVPFWCQQEKHQGNFIMQCGEESGISGDGLVYVFDDAIFAQFT